MFGRLTIYVLSCPWGMVRFITWIKAYWPRLHNSLLPHKLDLTKGKGETKALTHVTSVCYNNTCTRPIYLFTFILHNYTSAYMGMCAKVKVHTCKHIIIYSGPSFINTCQHNL